MAITTTTRARGHFVPSCLRASVPINSFPIDLRHLERLHRELDVADGMAASNLLERVLCRPDELSAGEQALISPSKVPTSATLPSDPTAMLLRLNSSDGGMSSPRAV